MALKKKKMYETQLEQCENNILRVNEQQMMLENQRTTVETVTALRDAAQASKSTMSEMKITDVDAVRAACCLSDWHFVMFITMVRFCHSCTNLTVKFELICQGCPLAHVLQ